jgi:hypothetical protein
VADKFNAKDALADYVTVPQRIAQFYELFGQGRLVTGEVRVELGPDGKPRVMVQAAAYRTPDDPLPGIGWSWMELPGTTSFTRGSELENTETSAWGRAIASLGILVDRSVATASEVASKAGDKPEPTREPVPSDEPAYIGPWSETGKLVCRKTGPADGQVRQGPDGPVLIVALETVDQKVVQLMATGALAADLYDAANGELDGLVATVEGDLYRVPWRKAGKPMPPYQRLTLARIHTPAWALPAPEAPSLPLFPEAEAELDGLL